MNGMLNDNNVIENEIQQGEDIREIRKGAKSTGKR